VDSLAIEDQKIIVNIKGVSARAWELAKNGAKKNDESLGSWISRAAESFAHRGDGEVFQPEPKISGKVAPANPAPIDLNAVIGLMLAMKENGLPVQKRVGTKVNALLYAALKDAAEPQAQLALG
jgi:hypothetical protein